MPDLHDLLASRWSPTVFDSRHELTHAEVELLMEAARWAPSAGNSQPWAFVIGRRGDATHRRLVRHLTRSSSRWASQNAASRGLPSSSSPSISSTCRHGLSAPANASRLPASAAFELAAPRA